SRPISETLTKSPISTNSGTVAKTYSETVPSAASASVRVAMPKSCFKRPSPTKPIRSSAIAIGIPSAIITRTAPTISPPIMRGSAPANQTSSATAATASGPSRANQRMPCAARGRAARSAAGAETARYRAHSIAATTAPSTMIALIGQTGIVNWPSTPANSRVTNARIMSGHAPIAVSANSTAPTAAMTSRQRCAAAGAPASSRSSSTCARVSRSRFTAYGTCRKTLATSDSETISVTPRIGLSNTVRPTISAQIRNVSANTQTTPAPFIRTISRSSERPTASDRIDRCCNTYIEPPSGVGQPVPVPERFPSPLANRLHVDAQDFLRRLSAFLGRLRPRTRDVRHPVEPLAPLLERQLVDDRALGLHLLEAALEAALELRGDAAAVLAAELEQHLLHVLRQRL